MTDTLSNLDRRSREIFRGIVESFLETGDPVGSRNLSRQLSISLSPASVRNVMSDLEHLGLIYSPHTSAGRVPTENGLRFFVDALLEVGDLAQEEREQIEAQVAAASQEQTLQGLLTEAVQTLSGLTRGAGVVVAPRSEHFIKHIEFVRLEPTKALVVLVGETGDVENRIISIPLGMPASTLSEATNYLNAHIRGRTLSEARKEIEALRDARKREIDALAEGLVETGLATWAGASTERSETLIVRGRGNLLEDLKAQEDLEKIRMLFDDLESKKEVAQLLGLAEQGEGVRIFIGSENKLFSLSGSSLVVAPYRDSEQRVIGALGVIGPTRLNYARIVPMVDYTAKVVQQFLG